MKVINIRKVHLSELGPLQELGKTTFLEAFGTQNTPEDMEQYLEHYFSLVQLQKELENPESQFFFASYENQLIGYLKVNSGNAQTEYNLDNALEIQRIYVLADFYGKKVGQQLLNKALEVAQENQFRTIWLGVWEKNMKAIRFYEKNGFLVYRKHNFMLGNDLQTDLMMKLEIGD